MLRKLVLCAILFSAFLFPSWLKRPGMKAPAEITFASRLPERRRGPRRAFLRNLYAWGSDYELKVGPSEPSPLLNCKSRLLSAGWSSDSAIVYVTKTGNFMFRGDLTDMSGTPSRTRVQFTSRIRLNRPGERQGT